jgi:alpha/beta superfamily hydrolase
VLFHPHSRLGGRLDNKVLYRIAKRLPVELSVAALRLNFRGVGRSAGRYAEGQGEREDALAGIDWLARRHGDPPIVAVGFSFGAVIGLRAAVADERVQCLVALGLPLEGSWDLTFLARTRKPRLFVQGERDSLGDARQLRSFVRALPGPCEIQIVPTADHLFRGQEDEAVEAVVDYIRRLVDAAEQMPPE